MAEQQQAVVKYSTDHGEVKLSPQIIRRYLVSGQGRVTDEEVMMFLSLCRYQGLNPFIREAYLIKYGDKQPATIITGKDVFTKRAALNPACKGYQSGVIFAKDGDLREREGAFVAPNDEVLLGGWAVVHREGWDVPLKKTVSMAEYARKNRDGGYMANWAAMPATMISKVALVQALREAFPADYQGMYSAEEMPVEVAQLETAPAPQPEEEQAESSSRPSTQHLGKMFHVARDLGWDDNSIKAHLQEHYGVASSKELTKTQVDEMIDKLQKLGPLEDDEWVRSGKEAQAADGAEKPQEPPAEEQ